MIWSLIFGFLKTIVGPIFNYLNAKVSADEQIHIIDSQTMGTIAGGGIAAATVADNLNAQIRLKQGNWGPMTLMMMVILVPFVWHEWQVVLDSSRWIPMWDDGWIPYIGEHATGTWRIPALPDPWGGVELAIFQSFFIGAAAATGMIAAIKAIKR